MATTVSQPGYFHLQEFTSAGALAVGGRLYFYTQGTTTKKDIYTEATGTTKHTLTSDGIGGEYLALDARGEAPAPIYMTSGAYDVCLKTSAGATVWTRRADPVGSDLAASAGAASIGFLQSGAGAVARTAQAKMRESVSVLDFGAVGDGSTDDAAAIQSAIDSLSTGGAVYFPSGTYKVSTGLVITTAGIRLYGDGPTSIVKDPGNVLALFIKASNIDVSGIKFLGTQSGSTYRQNLLVIGGTGVTLSQVQVTACVFENCSATCILIGGEDAVCSDVTVERNSFLNFYECAVDTVSSGNSRVLVSKNIIRTNTYNPDAGVSKPIGIAMEPQNSGVNQDFIFSENIIDFSALANTQMNLTHGITCNKHSVPATDFALKRFVAQGNIIKGVGNGIRLLDTRYGTTSVSASMSVVGNLIEQCRNHGIYVCGGETSTHRDYVVVSDNVVNGPSESTTNLYDGVILDQYLFGPIVSCNLIQRRTNESGATAMRYGVNIASANITSARIGQNSISQATSGRYNDASTSTVIEDFDYSTTASLTADNQDITVGNFRFISITSNDATAGNRTFRLLAGRYAGQRVILYWSGTNAGEYVDNSTAGDSTVARLSANWTPTEFDSIELAWDGSASWFEVARSAN